jgi:hypothetical protein
MARGLTPAIPPGLPDTMQTPCQTAIFCCKLLFFLLFLLVARFSCGFRSVKNADTFSAGILTRCR